MKHTITTGTPGFRVGRRAWLPGLLAVALMAGCAEETETPVNTAGAPQQLRLDSRVKPVITVEGLRFRDLNADGTLNPYEDWRT